MARTIGKLTADFDAPPYFTGLTRRGFRVRLGRGSPDENAARSNAWGSNAHVPLHSNAATDSRENPSNEVCKERGSDIRGTWEIVNAGDGRGLAKRVKRQLDGHSPGRNDRVCAITVCTRYSCLAELCGIDARAATYSETEFHDWRRGTRFLVKEKLLAAISIAAGIDNHYS